MHKGAAVFFGGVAVTMLAVGCGGAASPSASAPASPPSGGYPSADYAVEPGVPAAAPASASMSDAPAEMAAPAASKRSGDPVAVAPVAPVAPSRPLPQAGQLTAGIWDDNKNFDFFKPYATNWQNANGADFFMFAKQEMETARDRANGPQSAHGDIDVQIVLDTTGSMGDELSYLQSEFDSIAARLKKQFPNVTPRWSLVVYRDHGDEYLTRQFDFTTDTNRFRKDLRAQAAGGGGDVPEAVVDGLDVGAKQSWRQQNSVAKIAFWVADAPAHPGDGSQLAKVVKNIAAKGIHVYPVAASDTDDTAEYQMRTTAQMTGGRYIFLTNDSGVGNSHAEPHIPCYAVTRLDSAILRSIETELTGRHVEPTEAEVIRNVGQPDKVGQCKLPSGALVASF